MCPVISACADRSVEAKSIKGIPAEVIADSVLARNNQPNHLRVNDDGSLYVCFGKKAQADGRSARDCQFSIHLLDPDITKDDLTRLVDGWYQLRSEKHQSKGFLNDFQSANERILGLISRPSLVERRRDGFALHPLEDGVEPTASLIIFTTFESDGSFNLPVADIGETLHGKFCANGHVLAFVFDTPQSISFVDIKGNGTTIKVSPPENSLSE